MGQIGDLHPIQIGPRILQNRSTLPSHLHGKHPIQGSVNPANPSARCPVEISVVEIFRVQHAGDRGQSSEARGLAKTVEQRIRPPIGKPRQETAARIHVPALLDVIEHGLQGGAIAVRSVHGPGVRLSGGRQEQPAPGARLPEPRPEKVPAVTESTVERHHQGPGPNLVVIIGHEETEPATLVRFIAGIEHTRPDARSLHGRERHPPGLGLKEIAVESRQDCSQGEDARLGTAVGMKGTHDFLNAAPRPGGIRSSTEKERGPARRVARRSEQGFGEIREFSRRCPSGGLLEGGVEPGRSGAQGFAQRGQPGRVKLPLDAIERDQNGQQGWAQSPHRILEGRVSRGICIISHAPTLPKPIAPGRPGTRPDGSPDGLGYALRPSGATTPTSTLAQAPSDFERNHDETLDHRPYSGANICSLAGLFIMKNSYLRRVSVGSAALLGAALALACSGEKTAPSEPQASATPAAEAPADTPTERVLPSGLIFTETVVGAGPAPGPTSRVKVHYHGTFPDGRVFDSSVDRGQPSTFPVNRVIKCWTEGLQLMRVGGKATLVCPPGIAYGERGRPTKIPASSTLHFDVELLSVQ